MFIFPDAEPFNQILGALEFGVKAIFLPFESGHILHRHTEKELNKSNHRRKSSNLISFRLYGVSAKENIIRWFVEKEKKTVCRYFNLTFFCHIFKWKRRDLTWFWTDVLSCPSLSDGLNQKISLHRAPPYLAKCRKNVTSQLIESRGQSAMIPFKQR